MSVIPVGKPLTYLSVMVVVFGANRIFGSPENTSVLFVDVYVGISRYSKAAILSSSAASARSSPLR